MRVTIAARELHQAQAVTVQIETHGFGIDRHPVREAQIGGNVILVKIYRHNVGIEVFSRVFKRRMGFKAV